MTYRLASKDTQRDEDEDRREGFHGGWMVGWLIEWLRCLDMCVWTKMNTSLERKLMSDVDGKRMWMFGRG